MDRVPSDHPGVDTVDATLVRAGRTDRPRVAIPPAASDRFPAEEVVRLVVDGQESFSMVAPELRGESLELRGAFPTPEAARNPDDSDRLADWREEAGVQFGNTVHVDVVEEGFKYGLRAPGERAVYSSGGGPDEGLQDLARDLLDDS